MLNRVPDNFFAEVEQAAFDPAHFVPGIGPSPDRMLQGRLFGYGDAHRYRLGINHTRLAVNTPKGVKGGAQNYGRDGFMTDGRGGRSKNYEPNCRQHCRQPGAGLARRHHRAIGRTVPQSRRRVRQPDCRRHRRASRRGGDCRGGPVTPNYGGGIAITPDVRAALAGMAADAARRGDLDTLERALNAGVAVNTATPRGDSLLMLAAYYDQAAAVRLLLARGADPHQTDAKGQTPLSGVAFKGLIDIAELLVAAGAHIDAFSAEGRTPLGMAAAFNRASMVEWLLQHGASAEHRDASGLRPIDIANAMGAAAAVAALR